jgi:hypothetical protein
MTVKILVFLNGDFLITQIEEIGADIGDPDCKLIKPFLIKSSPVTEEKYLEPFLSGLTTQDILMINSDKILTIVDPNEILIEKYLEIIKE